MDLTPEQIASAQFVGSVRGYNREDVDAFLRGVADDYQRVLEELRALRATAASVAEPREPAPREDLIATVVVPDPGEPAHTATGEEPSPTGEAPPVEATPAAASSATSPEVPEASPPDATAVAAAAPDAAEGPAPEAADTAGEQPATTAAPSTDPEAATVRAILLAADEEAWSIRDAVEQELDQHRVEAMHTMEVAMRRAEELRDDARRRARALLDSNGDVADLADAVSRHLREADTAANDVLRSARAETRQSRRAMYDRLARAEAQARAVLGEAQEQACSILRAGAEAPGRTPPTP
jgi:DivIVA domain-containing protein